MFDCTLSFSTSFRTVLPFQYNEANEDLKQCGIDTRYPIWSDENNITEFVMNSMNLHRFLLNISTIDGVIVYYPLSIPFNVFAAYEGYNGDFVILDPEAETLWEDTANARWPSYCTNPLVLQLEENPVYYSGKFVAEEIFNPETTTREEATFDIGDTAPEMVERFAERGLLPVFVPYSTACCARKVRHMDYAVDFRLLRRPLQLSTRTMKRVEAPGFLEDPKNRRFASSVYFGESPYHK